MSRAVLLALFLAGCSSKPSAEKACKHTVDLRTKELDRRLEQLSYAGDSMVGLQGSLVAKRKELTAAREADVAKCVATVEARDLDTHCLMEAERIDHVLTCFGATPRGAED